MHIPQGDTAEMVALVGCGGHLAADAVHVGFGDQPVFQHPVRHGNDPVRIDLENGAQRLGLQKIPVVVVHVGIVPKIRQADLRGVIQGVLGADTQNNGDIGNGGDPQALLAALPLELVFALRTLEHHHQIQGGKEELIHGAGCLFAKIGHLQLRPVFQLPAELRKGIADRSIGYAPHPQPLGIGLAAEPDHFIIALHHLSRQGQSLYAFFRGLNPLAVAQKDGVAQFLLQSPDDTAEIGLGQTEDRSRAGNGPRPINGQSVLKLLDRHSCLLTVDMRQKGDCSHFGVFLTT